MLNLVKTLQKEELKQWLTANKGAVPQKNRWTKDGEAFQSLKHYLKLIYYYLDIISTILDSSSTKPSMDEIKSIIRAVCILFLL